MSLSASNTSLSRPARLLCYLGPPITLLGVAFSSPKAALFSPLAFIPTALCYYQWHKSNKSNPSPRGKLETMVWTYVGAGTIGLAACSLAQLGICVGMSTLLFGTGQTRDNFLTEIQRTSIKDLSPEILGLRLQLSRSWQVWLINFLFSFAGAGLVEETLKYLPIAYIRRRRRRNHHTNTTTPKENTSTRAYLDYTIAGSLGFGLIEGIGNIILTTSSSTSSSKIILRTLFERIIIGAYGHAIVGALTGLRATRLDNSSPSSSSRSEFWLYLKATLPSIILHGLNDFTCLSISALGGNVGWIYPSRFINVAGLVGVIAGLLTTATYLVYREEVDLGRSTERKGE